MSYAVVCGIVDNEAVPFPLPAETISSAVRLLRQDSQSDDRSSRSDNLDLHPETS